MLDIHITSSEVSDIAFSGIIQNSILALGIWEREHYRRLVLGAWVVSYIDRQDRVTTVRPVIATAKADAIRPSDRERGKNTRHTSVE